MTWSTPSIIYSGSVLTAAQWNAYAGVSSNVQFIKNSYNCSSFMTSFYAVTSVPNSTITAMAIRTGANGTSFIIPSAWGDGTYQFQVRIFCQTSETSVGFREIQFNTALAGEIPYTSFKIGAQFFSSFVTGNPGIYDQQSIKFMNVGDRLQVLFRHNSGVTTAYIMQGQVRKLSSY
jgi:hypothetical protein